MTKLAAFIASCDLPFVVTLTSSLIDQCLSVLESLTDSTGLQDFELLRTYAPYIFRHLRFENKTKNKMNRITLYVLRVEAPHS